MLTRFIRIQLAVFAIVGLVGMAIMFVNYVQVPTLLGIGRYEVTLKLPSSGGLYRFSNVTYRGVEIGKVTEVRVTPTGAEATMSIATSPKVPADLQAEVRSVSAVGEQYVDLRPRTDSGPFLGNGSVIEAENTVIPAPVGPVLDRVSALVGSFPSDRLSDLLDETYQGFNGAGYDFGSLIDSSATLGRDLNGIADQTRTLADDTRPLLEGQAATADSIRTWASSLAGFTGQLRASDPQFRTVLQTFPGFSGEVTGLLNDLKPTLPVLLANLGTVSEILMTYNASLEQLLVLLPPYVAQQQSYNASADSTGSARGDFAVTVGDPPACTVGFLPPSSWRSPADVSDIDTPDDIYCKLPQDSPIAVRGARNFPCIRHPGKRAPTIKICNSDKPFMPLAMREHTLGPYPFDPGLLAQGIPIDDRTTLNDDIHAPIEGTPLPPGASPLGTPPVPPPGPVVSPLEAPIASAAPLPPPPPGNSLNGQPIPSAGPPPVADPAIVPADPAQVAPVVPPATGPAPGPAPAPGPLGLAPGAGGAVPAQPSAFGSTRTPGPSVVVAQYNPRTGEYLGSDGKLYKVTNLVADAPLAKSWKDLLPH